jgi:tRNA A37 threonylcarbamoyltransferase TsaD
MASDKTLVMGFEGSANKIGIGIVNAKGDILANVPYHMVYISFNML